MTLKFCADVGYIESMKYVSGSVMKFWKSLIFDTQSNILSCICKSYKIL